VVEGKDHKESEEGGSDCSWNGDTPAGEPGFANGFGFGKGLLDGGQGKGDDTAAVGASGKMSERLLALVRGQSVFQKGAELVGIEMLVKSAHGVA
jgi:hypothetical protein